MEAKVSQTYTLAFLVKHPASREIVLRHLTPLGIDESRLSGVDSRWSELFKNELFIAALIDRITFLPAAFFTKRTSSGLCYDRL